jgi:3-deoxy-manno-octulosonate cytidylyltransferase (CMP-KDO synthetase)
MNTLAIIPARMNSSRFPGKPLAEINGEPMISHVYDRVRQNVALIELC